MLDYLSGIRVGLVEFGISWRECWVGGAWGLGY